MTLFRVRIAVLAVVAGLAAGLAPAPVVAEYACSMSGEVSETCCCAPKSGDDCPAIERACCCEISITAGEPITVVPATVVSVSALTLGPLVAVDANFFDASREDVVPLTVFRDVRPPGPALYLQHSSLLR